MLDSVVDPGGCDANHSLGQISRDSGPDVAGQYVAQLSVDASASQQVSVDAQAIGPLGPVQSWTGYVENYQFPSGSDTIRFSFASDPSGQVVGHVIFGSGNSPPPATDPDVGYPDEKDTGLYSQVEGFPYTMVDGNFAANRLRFTFQGFEPWTGWCALQTPALQPPNDSGVYLCIPGWNGLMDPNSNYCALSNPNGGTMVVDCAKMELCMRPVCICSATSCRVTLPEDLWPPSGDSIAPTASFDLALSGSSASGSIQGALSDHNVHFTQDP
jgi:hypothetical protein